MGTTVLNSLVQEYGCVTDHPAQGQSTTKANGWKTSRNEWHYGHVTSVSREGGRVLIRVRVNDLDSHWHGEYMNVGSTQRESMVLSKGALVAFFVGQVQDDRRNPVNQAQNLRLREIGESVRVV